MRRFLAALFAVLFAAPALAAPSYNPPFGLWRIPADQMGSLPFNLNGIAFNPDKDSPATVLAALNAIRAAHGHTFIQMVNFADMRENPPGNFQLSTWQARYDQWCPKDASGAKHCLNLQPYVADGTVLGLHIFEYSLAPTILSRKSPDLGQIQQVAAYVKTLWPYMPIALDTARPCTLVGPNWHNNVDLVLITIFTIRLTDYAHGEKLIANDVACANQAGLRYTLGPNPFGGIQNGMTSTSLSNFVHYAEYSLMYPGKVGTIIWRWWPGQAPTVTNGVKSFANFWSENTNPGIGAAMREIQACAANPTPSSCPHGSP
ncbi:MAG TPA: hypothetical protein VHU87_08705 [Rhizomicrobium sp.]|jgi:hypothetical protein|nr:hypothetical protein [Rhizomicrobium sp.]